MRVSNGCGRTRPARHLARDLRRAYARAHPDLKIMDLMDAQPEFTKAFWEYLDLLVSEDRIARGREILQQNRDAFDAMERAYGVDRHVIAAIWGSNRNTPP
jgi:membrane-bound lytic murein transglycosylase B